jgi:large subunit ribosomal protein L24
MASNQANSRPKFRIRKDDTVVVLAGKDRGKTGRVVRIIADRNRVVVEGVNMVKRHVRGTAEQPGRIEDREASLHISNVALWDADQQKAIKVGWQVHEDGTKVRVDRKSGTPIDNR